MSWKQEAKKIAAGKWIKFDASNPTHVLEFVGEPVKVQKESKQPGREGEKYFQMSFPVVEEEEDRVLEPNKSLLTQIISEDDMESIMGRTFMIKCLDPGTNRNWMIRPVGSQQTATRQWSEPKSTPDQYEKPAQRAIDAADQQIKTEKGEMGKEEMPTPEVKKPKAKRPKKEAAPVDKQPDNDQDS